MLGTYTKHTPCINHGHDVLRDDQHNVIRRVRARIPVALSQSLGTAERQKMHSRRDRPMIAVGAPAVAQAKDGLSLSGAFPFSAHQRNTTVYQTKASWCMNLFGAFAVLFCPGTQAEFYVVPTQAQGRKHDKGNLSRGPQPTFIIAPWNLTVTGTPFNE